MITYYDRKQKNYKIEKVAGDSYLNWIYSSPVGMKFLECFIKKKAFSSLYGWYCDRKFSSRKIASFIKKFDIDMSVTIKKTNQFTSFNDFFTRQLINDVRPTINDKNIAVSPGDGKILAYNFIHMNKIIQVKGLEYSLNNLIGNESIAKEYEDGVCIILRLCPTDYHRFHFIDNGLCEKTNKIKGHYYSVNPIALNKISNLFCENKREWCIFHSDNFDDVLYVEVGATCVGSIIQTYKPNCNIKKGDEKGYFKFGGSTIILFFKKDTIKVDEDIINQTSLGFESSVLMGEKIGTKL